MHICALCMNVILRQNLKIYKMSCLFLIKLFKIETSASLMDYY